MAQGVVAGVEITHINGKPARRELLKTKGVLKLTLVKASAPQVSSSINAKPNDASDRKEEQPNKRKAKAKQSATARSKKKKVDASAKVCLPRPSAHDVAVTDRRR